jgi:hypothetical protein
LPYYATHSKANCFNEARRAQNANIKGEVDPWSALLYPHSKATPVGLCHEEMHNTRAPDPCSHQTGILYCLRFPHNKRSPALATKDISLFFGALIIFRPHALSTPHSPTPTLTFLVRRISSVSNPRSELLGPKGAPPTASCSQGDRNPVMKLQQEG